MRSCLRRKRKQTLLLPVWHRVGDAQHVQGQSLIPGSTKTQARRGKKEQSEGGADYTEIPHRNEQGNTQMTALEQIDDRVQNLPLTVS